MAASVFLLFIDFTRENSLVPTRIIIDGNDEAAASHSTHIRFRESVLFEFSSLPETPAFAVVYRESCLISFLNELSVPVVSGRSVIGSLKFRVTEAIEPVAIDCKRINLDSRPVFIGHRGLGANKLGVQVRENTLESFNEAMKHDRLAGIELHVMLTQDGKLAVFHDMLYPVNINHRNAKLPISSLLYDRDMSSDSPQDQVPLLEDVLRNLDPPTAGIVIEIKYPTNDAIRMHPGLGKYSRSKLVTSVLDTLVKFQKFIADRWLVLSSFDPDIVWLLSDALRGSPILLLHNVWFGHEDQADGESLGHFKDTRNGDPGIAVSQARLLDTGMAFEADYVLTHAFREHFSESSLPMFSYGSMNLDLNNLRKQIDMHAFFIDNMDLLERF